MEWYLYHVKHPVGEFIGVARSESEAKEHFGARSVITPLQTDAEASNCIVNMRARGTERVMLAI